jgi:hypothetical protein
MRLAICSRSGDILEPMITPQWYVNCTGMAKRATDAVRNGDLKIVPSDHEKTWFSWLDNCRDWCVSRQLWWGHQIPAWFATKNGEDISRNDMGYTDRWVVARNEQVCYAMIFGRYHVAHLYSAFPTLSLGCLRESCPAPWLCHGRPCANPGRRCSRYLVQFGPISLLCHGLA